MTTPDIFYLIQRKSDGFFLDTENLSWNKIPTRTSLFESAYQADSFTDYNSIHDAEIVPFALTPYSYFKHCEIALGCIMQARNNKNNTHNDNT